MLGVDRNQLSEERVQQRNIVKFVMNIDARKLTK